MPDGKMKVVLQDIGNGIIRSEACDYDRESETQYGKIHVTTSNIKFEKILTVMHKLYSNNRHNQAFKQSTG